MYSFNILIFNKNYSSFLGNLFDSLISNGVVNNKRFNVFFYDDGSSDDSCNIFYRYFNAAENVKLINLTPPGNKRDKACFGQIEAINNYIDNYMKSLSDYVFLLDSDDYYVNDFFEKISNVKLCEDVYFCKIFNVNQKGEFLYEKEIKRKIPTNNMLWPSITNTSGIIIKNQFLNDYKEEILTNNKKYSDLWVDSRINIIANQIKDKSIYLDISINRTIHSNGDSNSNTYKRILDTQINAFNYTKSLPFSSSKMNYRVFIISLLSRVWKYAK